MAHISERARLVENLTILLNREELQRLARVVEARIHLANEVDDVERGHQTGSDRGSNSLGSSEGENGYGGNLFNVHGDRRGSNHRHPLTGALAILKISQNIDLRPTSEGCAARRA